MLVSFPSWSEDQPSCASKKTNHEEMLHRIEDERFNLDHIIESNLLTIKVLEAQERKMSYKKEDDRLNYTLNDTLGGNSKVIHKQAITRIYGEAKAPYIIEVLKSKPVEAIPIILARMKTKHQEWTEAKRKFAKFWRTEFQKNYEKSLDCQSNIFKSQDIKNLKAKKLLGNIDTKNFNTQKYLEGQIYEEKNVPHVSLPYEDRDIGLKGKKLLIRITAVLQLFYDAIMILCHSIRKVLCILFFL